MLLPFALVSLLISGAAGLDCYTNAATACDDYGCSVSATQTSATCTGTNQRCVTSHDYSASAADPEEYSISTVCADLDYTGLYCAFSAYQDAICLNYCSTTDCNNPYNVVTATAQVATSCLQCTSEDATSGNCYTGSTTSSTCELATHQYCTMMHTVVLDSAGAVSHEVVFRGCATTDLADGCWTDTTKVDSNDGTIATSVSCSQTCSGSGCNNAALPMNIKGSGRVCKSCMSSHGACASYVDMTCASGSDFCYEKVIYTDGDYYHATTDVDDSSYEVAIVYEERGCRAAAVTTACTTVTSDVAGSNFDVVSCEETCTTDRCNDDWPNRPKCTQCNGAYYDNTGTAIAETDTAHYLFCSNYPPEGVMCPDPSYTHCYTEQKFVPDGDNEVKWGFTKKFTRGCLKDKIASRCYDKKYRDEKEAKLCQFACTTDDCNQGSDADALMSSIAFILMASVVNRML